MTNESDSPTPSDQSFVDPTGFPYPHQPGGDQPDSGDSDSSQPPPPTEQIATATGHEPIYAWQMLDRERGWNIIGMQMQNGTTLPMVTTDMKIAWSLFEVAQQHANGRGVQCRLAAWDHPGVIAIVDPEPDRDRDS
jgi:hypothetical protein